MKTDILVVGNDEARKRMIPNNEFMKRILILALTVSLVSGSSLLAAQSGKPSPLKQALGQVPMAEMPAKAAQLVKDTNSRDRAAVAVQAVRAGLELSPTAAPTLVAAIAKAAPETAPAVAATAAQEQPQSAALIARAAAAAAPSKAGKIVAAVCRAVPAEYKKVAIAVAQVVPGAGKEILNGVGSAIPELKPAISAALAQYGKNPPSVTAVLDSPALASSSSPGTTGLGSSSNPRGPTVAPPYVPYSGTTSGLTPSDSGPVPRGDRDYASP